MPQLTVAQIRTLPESLHACVGDEGHACPAQDSQYPCVAHCGAPIGIARIVAWHSTSKSANVAVSMLAFSSNTRCRTKTGIVAARMSLIRRLSVQEPNRCCRRAGRSLPLPEQCEAKSRAHRRSRLRSRTLSPVWSGYNVLQIHYVHYDIAIAVESAYCCPSYPRAANVRRHSCVGRVR